MVKDDVRRAWRAVRDPGVSGAALEPRVERIAATLVGLLVLAGAIGTYVAICPLILPAPADARSPATVITPSTTTRQ